MKISVEAPPRTYRVHQQGSEVLAVQPGGSAEPGVLRSLPALLAEGPTQPETAPYEEVVYGEGNLPAAAQAHLAQAPESWEGSEVRTLVSQGPLNNRIDLTFVGDGYTAAQKARFFEDAQRLTEDLFAQTTFNSYLPLFNVHAVFVPSKEEGVSDVQSKQTALGLYRSPRGSKRAIMPGNTGAIEKALKLAPDTDFPILMANDDYYGGLGGRYAITTRSPQSGTMVLRHELGHNFGNVGEEYDGGAVYQGANHAHDCQHVPWAHWAEGPIRPEPATSLAAEYPWKNLAKGPLEIPLQVEGQQPARVDLKISTVGWETPQDVAVQLDGQAVPLNGRFTDDRSFFKLSEGTAWAPGRHTLKIQEQVKDGDNVLASVRANAFGADYDFTPGKIGAFPTFNQWGNHVGWRPTHEDCLMRDMEATEFCPVDRENMWKKFFQRVNLIDEVTLNERNEVKVATPDLPRLQIRWFQLDAENRSHELVELRDQPSFNADGLPGSYKVEVRFAPPEVRQPAEGFVTERTFTLS